MAVPYGKEVVGQADRLLKQGKTEPEVAKILGVTRSETIADWKRKYGIGKPKAKRMPVKLRERNLEIWERVQQDALKKLKKLDYSSAEEKEIVLERTEAFDLERPSAFSFLKKKITR